jgi:hypothetical protein
MRKRSGTACALIEEGTSHIARFLTWIAGPLLAAVLAGFTSQANATVLITVDTSMQQMSVWVDGIEQYN